MLPGTGIAAEALWAGAADIFARFAPRNQALLEKRDAIQAAIDHWHKARANQPHDAGAYKAFLTELGYLVQEPAPFTVNPVNVDRELAMVAGPQRVVPVLNARFLLNAANARWGSLYDALYGTDAIPGPPAARAMIRRVIAWAKAFLDQAVPLVSGSWAAWTGGEPALADPAALVGRAGDNLLLHNGLHVEVVIDRAHPIGKDDPAGIADVIL